jgi:hypothetical protein
VRAVFEHDEVVARRDGEQLIHVARQAVEMRRHDRSRSLGDEPLHGMRIEVEAARVDVGEDDGQARGARQLRHDPEGERRHDDLRARREGERLEHVVERGAAKGGGNRAPAAGSRLERALERRNLRALDEPLARPAARNQLLRVREHPRAGLRKELRRKTSFFFCADGDMVELSRNPPGGRSL